MRRTSSGVAGPVVPAVMPQTADGCPPELRLKTRSGNVTATDTFSCPASNTSCACTPSHAVPIKHAHGAAFRVSEFQKIPKTLNDASRRLSGHRKWGTKDEPGLVLRPQGDRTKRLPAGESGSLLAFSRQSAYALMYSLDSETSTSIGRSATCAGSGYRA